GDTGFANAARAFIALDDMHVDWRHLVDAQHTVVVEIGLRDPAPVDCDLSPKCSCEPEDQPALQLRNNGVRVDGDAGIDCRGDPAQMHFALPVDFSLDYSGNEAAERWLHADTATSPRRQRLAPAGFFRNQLQRRLETGRPVEHAEPKGNRVYAGVARELIDEALGGENVVVRSHSAPKSGRHGRGLGAYIFNDAVRDIVRHVDGAIDGVDIDAVLKPWRKPARHDRRTGHPIFPGHNPAVRQGCGDRVAVNGSVNVVLYVLFARPHDLNRTVNVPRNTDGTVDHVHLEPAPKATTDIVVVHDYSVDRNPGGFRCSLLRPCHDLRAGPDFAAV